MQGDLMGHSFSYFELAFTVTWHIIASWFLLSFIVNSCRYFSIVTKPFQRLCADITMKK